MLQEYAGTQAPPSLLLDALAAASDKLTADFGSWKTPWGDINRFQRLTGDIVQPFSDTAPSIPVPFTYSYWGSLASFSAKAYPGTKKRYGTSGNSFVAVVEFGDKCAPARSPQEARAATLTRPTSTTKPSATLRETCARSISTRKI